MGKRTWVLSWSFSFFLVSPSFILAIVTALTSYEGARTITSCINQLSKPHTFFSFPSFFTMSSAPKAAAAAAAPTPPLQRRNRTLHRRAHPLRPALLHTHRPPPHHRPIDPRLRLARRLDHPSRRILLFPHSICSTKRKRLHTLAQTYALAQPDAYSQGHAQ